MDMTGEQRISASRSVVWEALNDPDVLKQSISGCEKLDKTSPTDFSATVTAKIGPVKAKFNGAVTLSDLNPPESYTISGEGKGGVAGFVKGQANVSLTEDGSETVLSYKVKAQVGGKLAQLGSRLIASTARKMADDFFKRFSEIAAERAGAGSMDAAAATVEAAASVDVAPPPDESRESIAERVVHAAEKAEHEIEERLETEAAKGTLGGPVMWGFIALAVVILLLLLLR